MYYFTLKIYEYLKIIQSIEILYFLKWDELASRTFKDLNLSSFLPSPFRQNLEKNQNLDKQINSFHIQITLTL